MYRIRLGYVVAVVVAIAALATPGNVAAVVLVIRMFCYCYFRIVVILFVRLTMLHRSLLLPIHRTAHWRSNGVVNDDGNVDLFRRFVFYTFFFFFFGFFSRGQSTNNRHTRKTSLKFLSVCKRKRRTTKKNANRKKGKN